MNQEEKYYEIVDRPSSEVNSAWKRWHLTFISIGIITGLAATISFAVVRHQFSSHCILNAQVNYTFNHSVISTNEQIDGNLSDNLRERLLTRNVYLNVDNFHWGDDWVCEYVQFVPLISLILGALLASFFFMYPKGGTNFSVNSAKETYAWHLVVPTLLVSTIYFIVLLICFFKLHNGFSNFCDQFEYFLEGNENLTKICSDVLYSIVLEVNPTTKLTDLKVIPYMNLYLTSLFLLVCCLAWLLLVVSLVMRILFVVDFKVLEVTVTKTQPNEYKPLEKDKFTAVLTDSDSAEEDTITVEY